MSTKHSASTWRSKRDPLWRGDGQTLSAPAPKADRSIVRHILYLGGMDRTTPYHSTTEVKGSAAHFAANGGRIWHALVSDARAANVGHISRLELLRLLKGRGQGDARWADPFEVLQAKRYVNYGASIY